MKEQARERTRSGTDRAGTTPVARLFAIGICAACGAHPPAETHDDMRSPSQPASLEAKPLDLTVRVRAERDGRRWSVASGDTLKTGDFFELFVYLNQPAYIYVIQMLPDGRSTPLFPTKGDRLLAAGLEHRIPDATDESFQIDSHDNEENVYILMSRAPIVEAGALISAPAHQAPVAGDKRNDMSPHPLQKRDQRSAEPESLDLQRQDRILSITTRRVIRVKRPYSRPTTNDSAAQSTDSTLFVRLFFWHV